IPVMKSDYVSQFETKMHKLVLPATPSKMFDLLSFVKDNLPKDSVVTNADDKKIMKKLAETKRDEPLRILVAEDNPINLKLVQVVLGRYDFIIESASNGEKAVEMCKKVHYDLILMDIDMPIMDGVTANKLIKEYQKSEGIPTTPVVALTSHDMIGERSEILAKGLDEHMAKPLNIARLEMMLERYLGYKSKK
ncbi:MAG: response regulator, partial [Thiovulaceae bacterium]|nr:response regulator [Sulfurimonadaceae bacterium]